MDLSMVDICCMAIIGTLLVSTIYVISFGIRCRVEGRRRKREQMLEDSLSDSELSPREGDQN